MVEQLGKFLRLFVGRFVGKEINGGLLLATGSLMWFTAMAAKSRWMWIEIKLVRDRMRGVAILAPTNDRFAAMEAKLGALSAPISVLRLNVAVDAHMQRL